MKAGAPIGNSLDLFLRGETDSYPGVDVRPWMLQRIFLDGSPVRHEKKLP